MRAMRHIRDEAHRKFVGSHAKLVSSYLSRGLNDARKELE